MWKPISEEKLQIEISRTESLLEMELLNFWQLIRIQPEKWSEEEFGNTGGGFWVVAISGNRIIWYNDIEEGFNISHYRKYAEIDNYTCDQFELNQAVWQLYNIGEHTLTRQPAEPFD